MSHTENTIRSRSLSPSLSCWCNGIRAMSRRSPGSPPCSTTIFVRLAQGYLRRERADHTIQKTALVHEAFARLVDQQAVDWQGRSHFFALASRLMRGILVDHARARLGRQARRRRSSRESGSARQARRRRKTACRSIKRRRPRFNTWMATPRKTCRPSMKPWPVSKHIDPRQAQIVEMRYFGGLTIEQTADAMGISDATVKREWMHARAWLRCELGKHH